MMIRWNPWSDIARLESFFDHRNERFGSLGQNGDAQAPQPTWTPAVDVYEDEAHLLLVADLPGVEDKDLSISVDKNVLTVRGDRKAASRPEENRRVERVQGAFSRSFTLPPTVDTETIGAELKAGVLTLTLPKKQEAKPRQIKIKAA